MENNQQIGNYRWNIIFRILLALFAAVITPPVIALILSLASVIPALLDGGRIQQDGNWTPFIGIVVIILIVSLLHVVLLGISAFVIGWYFNKIRWWTSIIVAFLIGSVPTAIFLWPLKYPDLHSTSSRWDGEKMVQTMIDGVPTFTGWTDWISAFIVMGLFGASGGLVFWLVWRQHSKSAS